MNTPIKRTGALTPAERAAVEGLVGRVASHDGVQPLNEVARFALAGKGHAVHWLAHRDGQVIGYAQCCPRSHSAQLLVDPDFRRQGIGTALSQAVLAVEKTPVWWAFGNLAGAQALAATLGASLQRELLIMERDMMASPVQGLAAPDGITIRRFRDSDAEALVEVNGEAFASHPEQGALSLADFRMRAAEAWFDPDGILVAIDDESGALLGFHWTKTEHSDPQHPDELVGEVYVIGVSPDASGRGIGRALLDAGLAHLTEKGVRRVCLYVEASSARVVRMYEAASFKVITRDASYAC
ncbi:mycothiol synthase [Luteococcus sp. Sow4_B9]|uniref:mycothiol synthase n=1 Tax=Luteococcus sp. Sow4_B9 TaxID=3438792 RepID=UPI003F99C7FF